MNENCNNEIYNLEGAENLGGMKEIKRLPGMSDNAPEISWGDSFAEWTEHKRMRYAMRLASAMNHAADVCQKERDKVIELASIQEKQLEQLKVEHNKFVHVVNQKLAKENSDKQELYQKIVDLTNSNSKQGKALQAACNLFDGPCGQNVGAKEVRMIEAIRKLCGN